MRDMTRQASPSLMKWTRKNVVQGELKGLHLFVCAHGSRDARCGAIGNALVTRLSELVWQQQLDGQVHIHRCSHVGGHKVSHSRCTYFKTC